jgi:hypothetical protein
MAVIPQLTVKGEIKSRDALLQDGSKQSKVLGECTGTACAAHYAAGVWEAAMPCPTSRLLQWIMM